MISFICSNLLLAILVGTQNEYLTLLESPFALTISLFAMGFSLLAGYLKKLSTIAWHDGFSTAGLFVWYAYWKPSFDTEVPMFLLFPIYFALLSSVLTLVLINRAQYFDLESVQSLRYLEKLTRIDIGVLILFVMASLLITRHYALYPMAMTFFLIRHTMIVCLETIDS